MSNLIKQFKQLSFEGISFPYREIAIDGAMREHTHIYPHSAGGAPEKLGRDLYIFDVTSAFRGDLLPERYRKLWPANLAQLVALFEQGKTGDLVLPQIGAPIRAFCTNWKRVLKATITNGEDVTLKFKEDREDLRLPSATIVAATKGLSDAYAQITAPGAKLPNITLLDKILGAVNSALALKDQWDLYGNLIEAKCLAVIQMIREVLEVNEELMKPEYWAGRDLLHNLLSQVIALRDDVQDRGMKLRVYPVKIESTLAQVSLAIYGRTTRASELLALNSIPDPFVIFAGTKIKYYADAA